MKEEHFRSIDEVMAMLRAEVPANPFAGMAEDGTYVWITEGKEGRLVPSPGSSFWSPFLYRGQTQRYLPCLPGIFRGMPLVDHPQKLSQLDRAKCFLGRVRLKEFLMALVGHPAYAYSKEIQLIVCEEALAQHYELATGRVDLSQDPDVAAFFATNWRDEKGQWHPSVDGTGVIYRAAFSDLQAVFKERWEFVLEWIGKQAWPRPGEQKGWTLLLPLGVDFEKLPVDILTFDHHEACGQRFHDMFQSGRKLFPPDVLSDVAAAIQSAPTMARDIVGKVLALQGFTGDEHRRELDASAGFFMHHFGIDVVDRAPIQLSPDQLAEAEAQLAETKKHFLSDVRLLLVRRATPMQVGDRPSDNQMLDGV